MSVLLGKYIDVKYSINKELIVCKSAKMILTKSFNSKVVILVTLDRLCNLSHKIKIFVMQWTLSLLIDKL